MSNDNVVTIASEVSHRETVARLEAGVAERGFTVFARIDHAAAAAEVGMELRPTFLLVFGNPEVGTFLMQDQQRVGLDLPVKVLVWEDADSRVWLSRSTAASIAERHALGNQSAASIRKIDAVLGAVCSAAAYP